MTVIVASHGWVDGQSRGEKNPSYPRRDLNRRQPILIVLVSDTNCCLTGEMVYFIKVTKYIEG